MEPSNPSQSAQMKQPSASPFNPFKSKKILRSNSKSASSEAILSSDPNTPEKTIQFKQRSRNKSTAFSVNDVRRIAQGLQKSSKAERPDPLDLIESPQSPKKGKRKKAVDSIRLPEKFEMLAKVFDSMVCSIRLLRIKRTICTFTNIGKNIESMTDRRFSYNHLAQLKYILPEAIVLKKELMLDEQTLCMRPCLQVTLEIDAIENDGKWKEGIGFSNVGKVFRSRLLAFIKAHPEVDEIPEETLPEPFNQMKEKVITDASHACTPSLPAESPAIVHPQQNSATVSHLSRSFQKRFSQKVRISESEKTPLLSATAKQSSQVVPHTREVCSNEGTSCKVVPSPMTFKKTSLLGASPVGLPLLSSVRISDELTTSANTEHIASKETNPFEAAAAKVASTPIKLGDDVTRPVKNKDLCSKETSSFEGTPAKLISTPARLMAITPDLQTPKRCHISQDDAYAASPDKLVRRLPRNRPLFQTPVKSAKAEGETHESEKSSIDANVLKLLPKTLVQSIREQEKRTIEGQDVAISEAKRRRQMIASLPKLFNMIHLIFSSDKRCVITKQELVHRIISSHFDILDRGELEEQLKLLQELVPDWISEKVTSSGDLLLRVNKMSCADSVRRRLEEAL